MTFDVTTNLYFCVDAGGSRSRARVLDVQGKSQAQAASGPCNPATMFDQAVESIRHLMFVFEDLLMVDVNSVKEILSRVDRKILTIALKGTSDQMKAHMLQAMSSRGAEMMREDMDALGAIKIKDVEGSQQAIIALVRQLESEGTLSLKGSVGEQYVV